MSLALHNLVKPAILPSYFHALNHRGKFISVKMRTIHPDDGEELYAFAKSMAHIFSANEPMTVAAGITEEEFFEEIWLYLQYAKKDRLSLILTNEEDGKIIGGIIGRDFYYDETENPYTGLANLGKFSSIFDMINVSRKRFVQILKKEGHRLHPGLVYRGAYIGFLSKYITLQNEEGINLTAFSFRTFEEYLKGLGYQYFYGEATNPGSQKLFRNSGWTIHEIVLPYIEYTPFKHITFHNHALSGIGDALCGAIQRLSETFPPIPNKLINQYRTDTHTSLGSPHNRAFRNDHLAPYLNFHVNNTGNPKKFLTDRLHACNEEIAVLHFTANLYKLPLDEMWGYMTAGGIEANEMGLYLARCKYPDGIVYASQESHYCIRAITHKLQMPLEEIDTLDNGEINYIRFEQKIRTSDAPAIINVNIGTTMKGAIDNLPRIISILRKTNRTFYIHCDAALHGGFLPFLNGAPEIHFGLPIDSLAVSLDNFLGIPFPSATFISRKTLQGYLPDNLHDTRYSSSKTHTLSCSQNGHAAIFAYSRIIQLGGIDGMKVVADGCIATAEYTEMRLRAMNYPGLLRNPYSPIVAMMTPSKSICEKWQLSTTKELSHIILMPHVTKEMVDAFIKDVDTFLQSADSEQKKLDYAEF